MDKKETERRLKLNWFELLYEIRPLMKSPMSVSIISGLNTTSQPHFVLIIGKDMTFPGVLPKTTR